MVHDGSAGDKAGLTAADQTMPATALSIWFSYWNPKLPLSA
jgi:hypothetical protein